MLLPTPRSTSAWGGGRLTRSFSVQRALATTRLEAGAIRNQELTLNDGGAITVSSPVINDQLINANVILGTDQGTSSTITFTNDSTTASLTIAGDVIASTSGAGSGTKILALEGGNGLISGDIRDGGPGGATIALTKDGIGTWTLSASNTYSGTTVVNGGTLLVNNTLGSGTGSGDVIVNTASVSPHLAEPAQLMVA